MNPKVYKYVFREDRILIHGFAVSFSSTYAAEIYVQSLPVETSPVAQYLCRKYMVAPIESQFIL